MTEASAHDTIRPLKRHHPPGAAAPPTPLIIHDRTAIAGWVFMGIWMGMLALFTWIMERDGPSPSQPADLQYAVLGVFWLVGIPVTARTFAMPVSRLCISADGAVLIHRRSLWTREVERYAAGSIAAVEVRPARDSEGDPTFRTMLVAADGRERLIREGADAAAQETIAMRVRAALGQG